MPEIHDVHLNTAGVNSIPEAPAPSSSPRPSSAPDSSTSNIFTCTFCWQVVSTRPSAVGRSARLACEQCYSSLIDLAVCWACGEVVVRGDDCVSLGWCFWHRICYGCLFYGNKRVVKGKTLSELYQDGEGDSITKKRSEPGRGKGVEINEIPLCANCFVENETESLNEDTLAQRALRRITPLDGGISRHRWEEKSNLSKASKVTEQRGSGSETLSAPIVELMGQLPGDGALSEMPYDQVWNAWGQHTPSDSTIYVSMHDPFGTPSFKPSLAKPIPTWMQYRPRQLVLLPETLSQSVSGSERHSLPSTKSTSLPMNCSSPRNSETFRVEPANHSTPSPKVAQHGRETSTVSKPDSSRLPQGVERQGPSPIRYPGHLSFVSDEPLMQPSSIHDQYIKSGRRRSSTSVVPAGGRHYKSATDSIRSRGADPFTKLVPTRCSSVAPPQMTSPEHRFLEANRGSREGSATNSRKVKE